MILIVVEFILFTALVAVISWYKTRDEDLSSKEGYFLAGRGLPGIVIAGSLMMTNLSAEQLVGTNGQSFAGNMSPNLYVVFALFCLECVIYWLCTKYAPRAEDWEMPNANVIDMTPWKTGKAWAIAGALFVVLIFWICSPLGIAG